MAFAPGKVILLGEHAVVYGYPALAGALAVGVHVETAEGYGHLHVPAWGITVRAGVPSLAAPQLAAAYTALLESLAAVPGFHVPLVDLTAHLDLPPGSGLGSSAALSVALARALGAAAGVTLGADALCSAAMAAEKVFHGNPSGIDHAVSAQGGFGLFTRSGGLRPLGPCEAVPLVVGHTGRERDTKGRVARVAALLEERPEETRACFVAIADLVITGAHAAAAGDLGTLGEAMDDNQQQLAMLDVSSPEIDRMCALARDVGAAGAKLTGGGGGGCVIALAPGREEGVRAAWERAGFKSFVTRVGGAVTG